MKRFNATKRIIFVAELQAALGGSENARNDAFRLMRYSMSHFKLSYLKDTEGLRKLERIIRSLLLKWHVEPLFQASTPDAQSTVNIKLHDGSVIPVPYMNPMNARTKERYGIPEDPEWRHNLSRFKGRNPAKKDGGEVRRDPEQ